MDVSAGAIPWTEFPETGAQAATFPRQSADSSSISKDTQAQNNRQVKRKKFSRRDSRASNQDSIHSNRALFSDDNQDHVSVERPPQHEDWGVGDDVKMGLG